jgi:hypothetical protein
MPLTQTVWGSLASVGRIEESDGAAPTLNPWIFHGANVLIHVASSLLILHILQSLTRNRPAAWFGAALFAVHPVQVESVAWASGTKDLLCVFFILVSIALLIAHRAKPHPARMSLMTVAIAATCLSKPTGIVGPVMLLIIDVMLLGTSPRRSLQALAPALVIACVFAVIAQRVQPPVIAQLPPLWSRPLIAGDALAFYLVKLVWPTRLAIDYGRSPAKVMAQGWLYYTWLLPAVVTILLIWIRRHNPAMIRTVIAAAILASSSTRAASTWSSRCSIAPTSSAWWSSKCPVSASIRSGILRRILECARSAIAAASRLPATSSASIARADTVVTDDATAESLIEASSSSFSNRTASRVRSPIS